MPGRLHNKVAIITGSGGGIGRACALLMAAEGASVLVNDTGKRTGANADAVVSEIKAAGGTAVANRKSATWDSAASIVQDTLDAFGRVDILINNATAGGKPADLWRLTEEDWDLSFAVNAKGYFAMIRAVAPHFCKQQSGIIVNMSSGSGFGHASMVAYSSAKEGIVGLTRTVARELGRFGVRCNAIRPLGLGISSGEYAIHTAKWTNLIMLTAGSPAISTPMFDATPETHPQSKIAPMMAWLCTDAAKGINGRTFHVRGDQVALMTEPGHEREMTRLGGWTLDALDTAAPSELVPHLANNYLLDDQPELKVFDPESA